MINWEVAKNLEVSNNIYVIMNYEKAKIRLKLMLQFFHTNSLFSQRDKHEFFLWAELKDRYKKQV